MVLLMKGVLKMKKDERICAYCENIITGEDYYEIEGKFYCKECMGVCQNCNSLKLYDDMTLTNLSDNSQGYVCNRCIDETNAFFYCDHCEEYYPADMLWNRYEGEPICNACSEHYDICENCRVVVRRNQIYYCDRTDEYLCYDCYEDKRSSISDLLYEYSYKPIPIFYKCDDESDDKYDFLGVELECDVGDEYDEEKIYNAIEKIADDYSDRLYCKRDSSLSDIGGAEFVSHPCSLKYHMKEFGWDNILKTLLDGTLRGHDAKNSAGIHVHMDRRYFGDTQEIQDLNIAKLMLVMSKFYNSHIIKFSRRKEESALRWCADVGMTMDSTDDEHTVIDKMKKCKDRGRYQCINLCNFKTLEFRIFRSTLNRNTFIACLQFCIVISDFAKRINLEDIPSCEWKDIFLCSNYSELNKYLNERGLI